MDIPNDPNRWFATKEEFERFLGIVRRTYGAVANSIDVSGIATGDYRHAVLLSHMIQKMLAHIQTETVKLLEPELRADLERETAAMWKPVKLELDSKLAEARELYERLRPDPESESVN